MDISKSLKMKNIKYIILIIIGSILLLLTQRFIFSYTIITVPNTIGKVFVGGYKYDFPICIVNQYKTSIFKDSIMSYVKYQLEDSTLKANKRDTYEINHYRDFKWWFFERLGKIPEIKIISVNNERNRRCVLLQSIDNPQILCIAFIDKNTGKVIRIDY